MSFLKNLFAPKERTSPEEKERQERQRRVQTLKDDGVRALKMHEYPTAARFLAQAMTLQPDDSDVWRWLSEAYLRAGETDKALPVLSRLADAEPDNLSVLLALAQAAATLKQWTVMAEALQKAGRVDGENAQVYYLQAVASHGQGDDLTAEANLTHALQLDPTLAAAYRLRADVLMDLDRPAQAEADLDRLLQHNAEADELWVAKGEACRAQHNNDGAAAAYRRAREANPFNEPAVLRLASLQAEEGHADESLQTLSKAIDEQPDFADALRARATLRLSAGDRTGAEADEARAEQIKPTAKEPDAEYTALENRVEDKLRTQNPFGF